MGSVYTEKMSKSLDQRIAKEFRKSFFHDVDRQFLVILFLSLFVETVTVSILAQRPVPEYGEKEISRIQERFANFVLGKPIREEEINKNGLVASSSSGVEAAAEKEEASESEGGEGTGTGEKRGGGGGGGSAEVRRVSRLEAAEARRLSREAVSREVSNRGLLGLLTGTGRATEGEAVSSFFHETQTKDTNEDLDRVLSSVKGLKTQGRSGIGLGGEGGTNVRGERTGGKANIDDLVSDLGDAPSESLSRKGELVVENPAEVEGLGKKSVYRSAEAIQEVLMSHVPAIRYCYERELKRNPTLKGKVSVRITLSPDGSVKDATIVSSTLDNERVERCILARIRLWKDFNPIDPSEGDVTFRQVYTFGY